LRAIVIIGMRAPAPRGRGGFVSESLCPSSPALQSLLLPPSRVQARGFPP
jgi:hypothetical protein